MNVKELKEFLNTVDDDFEVIIGATKKTLEEGWDMIDRVWCTPKQGDIGHSSKIIHIDIDLDEDIN